LPAVRDGDSGDGEKMRALHQRGLTD